MYTEEYEVFPYRYYRYHGECGKNIFCKKLNTVTFEEVKIDPNEFEENRPKTKLTLEKKSKDTNINF